MRKTVSIEGYMTAAQCGEYGHVSRQAVHQAMKNGWLPYTLFNDVRYVTKEDYDAFRETKYNTPRKIVDGKPLYSFEEGRYTVGQVAKIFSDCLGYAFQKQRLYYMLRRGRIKGYRSGGTYVILKEDALNLLKKELARKMQKKSA